MMLPRTRHDGKDDRKQLQTSGQHVEHEDKFGKYTVAVKVADRADFSKSGTDIVQGSGNRGEICRKIQIVDADCKHGQ